VQVRLFQLELVRAPESVFREEIAEHRAYLRRKAGFERPPELARLLGQEPITHGHVTAVDRFGDTHEKPCRLRALQVTLATKEVILE